MSRFAVGLHEIVPSPSSDRKAGAEHPRAMLEYGPSRTLHRSLLRMEGESSLQGVRPCDDPVRPHRARDSRRLRVRRSGGMQFDAAVRESITYLCIKRRIRVAPSAKKSANNFHGVAV
jgi:hypothetical protein